MSTAPVESAPHAGISTGARRPFSTPFATTATVAAPMTRAEVAGGMVRASVRLTQPSLSPAAHAARVLASADMDLAYLHHLAHRALMHRDAMGLARVADAAATTLARLSRLDPAGHTAGAAPHRHAHRLRVTLAALAARVAAVLRRLLTTLRAAAVIASQRLAPATGPRGTRVAGDGSPPPLTPTCPHTTVCTLLTAPQAPPAYAAARV